MLINPFAPTTQTPTPTTQTPTPTTQTPTLAPSYYSYYFAAKLRCKTVFNSSIKFLDPLRYNS